MNGGDKREAQTQWNGSAMNNPYTPLRHDLLYLRCILTHATKHHPAQTPKDRLTQATLQDYLTWLTTDALQNEKLARHLAPTLARLQEELHNQARNSDPTTHAYYEGYIHAAKKNDAVLVTDDRKLHTAASKYVETTTSEELN